MLIMNIVFIKQIGPDHRCIFLNFNTSILPKKFKADSAVPDQTAPNRAVWSGSPLYAILKVSCKSKAL